MSGIRKERDPIDKLKRITKELGYADDASIKEMEKTVRTLVDEAVEFAKTSPEPELNELYTQVLNPRNPKSSTPNPQSSTPTPSTLNPRSSTLNSSPHGSLSRT